MALRNLTPRWQQIFLTLQELEEYSSTLWPVLKECANLDPGEKFQPARVVRRIIKTGPSIADRCNLLDAILSVALPGSPYHRISTQMVRWHVEAILAILSTKLNDENLREDGQYLAHLAETCGYDISALLDRKLRSASFHTLVGFVLEYGKDNTVHTTHVQERHLQYPLDIVWCDMQVNFTNHVLDAEELYHLLQLTKKHSQVSLAEAFEILLQSTASIEDLDIFQQVLLPLIDLLLWSHEDLPTPTLRQAAPLFPTEFIRGQVGCLHNDLFQAVASFICHTLTRYLRLTMPAYPRSSPNDDIDWTIEAPGCGCKSCCAISFYLSYPAPKNVRMNNITNGDILHMVDYFKGSSNSGGTVVCDIQYENIVWPFTICFSKRVVPNEATLRQRLKYSAAAANQQRDDWNAWHATTQRLFRRIDDGLDDGSDGARKQRLFPFLKQHYEAVMSCNPTLLPYTSTSPRTKRLERPALPKSSGPPVRFLPNSRPLSQQSRPQSLPRSMYTSNAGGDILDSAELPAQLIQVHHSHILPETLDHFYISWRSDPDSKDHIVIEQQVPEATLLDMFSHTQRIYDSVKRLLKLDGYGKF